MEKPHLLSIIIPTYNRCHMLGETLDSIIDQTYQNWECILVDDHSSDYTPELVEFYKEKEKRIKYYKRPENSPKGANSCRNYGFEKSEGDYVNWFDSDDLLAKDYFQKQLENLGNGKWDGSIADFSVFKKDPTVPLKIIKNRISGNEILPAFVSGNINPALQGFILDRKIVQDQSWNTSLTWADDLEFLFLIFRKKNVKLKFLKENKVFLRRHENSLTGNYNSFDPGEIKSELEVRRCMLHYAIENDFEKSVISGALDIYFRGFKMLFLSHKWRFIKAELNCLKKNLFLKKEYVFWKTKLQVFYILQRLKYKRIRLQDHFHKFEILILEIPNSQK